jgi:hypothetical protein
MVALIVVFFCLALCASLSANIWLSRWTDKAKVKEEGNNTSSSSSSSGSQIFNMNIYSALGITQGNQVCLGNFLYSSFSIFEVFLRLLCSWLKTLPHILLVENYIGLS